MARLRLVPPSHLVSGIKNPRLQTQPNGVELTVADVFAFTGSGEVGLMNRHRKVASVRKLPFDHRGRLPLSPGSYRVRLNETVRIPLDMFAIGRPRSSLLRSGVAVHTALWDSGYEGRSEVLISVLNPHGFTLRRNARILQLVFFRLPEAVKRRYRGRYHLENMGMRKQSR
jgi:dUTP pyrophosphatase